ncbi:MAG: ethanolamine utilization protein EutE, partial [Lachnospiraceae bacterium]|nr:ethanolamine utilization protein EutE [Lachnospiraceae bacterium]
DPYHVTQFGKLIETTVYVQNGGTMAAFGIGGSGSNSPTIATPTGEGVTGPRSYCRIRRFAMADGLNYVV